MPPSAPAAPSPAWTGQIEACAASPDKGALTCILDDLAASARAARKVTVDDLAGAFGHRGFGPFLILPALVELSPVGAIPGVPTLLAAIIALFAVQIVLGCREIWLPRFLDCRTLPARRLRQTAEAARPVAHRLDRLFSPRLPRLAGRAATRAAAAACLVLCLTVPPLELLPFASSAPMLAIATLGLAMMVKDGLLMAIGFALTAIAAAVGIGLLVF